MHGLWQLVSACLSVSYPVMAATFQLSRFVDMLLSRRIPMPRFVSIETTSSITTKQGKGMRSVHSPTLFYSKVYQQNVTLEKLQKW